MLHVKSAILSHGTNNQEESEGTDADSEVVHERRIESYDENSPVSKN